MTQRWIPPDRWKVAKGMMLTSDGGRAYTRDDLIELQRAQRPQAAQDAPSSLAGPLSAAEPKPPAPEPPCAPGVGARLTREVKALIVGDPHCLSGPKASPPGGRLPEFSRRTRVRAVAAEQGNISSLTTRSDFRLLCLSSNQTRSPMSYSHSVPDVGTSDAPSWTIHGQQIWMAWKGQGTDKAIYIAFSPTLQANPDPTTGTYHFSEQFKLPDVEASTSPTIASWDHVLYLLWKGDADNFIYLSSSSDGKTWTKKNRIMTAASLSNPADARYAKTSHRPAAVIAFGALFIVYKGESTNDIYMTGPPSDIWRELVVTPPLGNKPQTDSSPAVAGDGDKIYLIWKGASSDDLWWTQSVAQGSWSEQQRIFRPGAYSPALVIDGNRVPWLAWVNAAYSDTNIPWPVSNSPFASPQLCFASFSKGKWSAAATRLGIEPGSGPSLISTAPDSTYIMMAWKGPGDVAEIFYGPLRLPARSYIFEVSNYICFTTRSGSAVSWFSPATDTDYLSLSVQVSNSPGAVTASSPSNPSQIQSGGSQGASVGGSVTLPPIVVPDNGVAVMTYYILNSSQPQASEVGYAVVEKIASAGASAAESAAGAALAEAIGAAIGTAVVPLIGSAIGAAAGWLIGEAWNIAFPGCDGPVALGVRAYTAAELSTATGVTVTDQQPSPGMQPPMVTQDGCGSNPLYEVQWSVKAA